MAQKAQYKGSYTASRRKLKEVMRHGAEVNEASQAGFLPTQRDLTYVAKAQYKGSYTASRRKLEEVMRHGAEVNEASQAGFLPSHSDLTSVAKAT